MYGLPNRQVIPTRDYPTFGQVIQLLLYRNNCQRHHGFILYSVSFLIAKFSSMTAARTRPRRTHSLGGCRTCRRRHVKCDQKRPACMTCRALGVTCEGFSEEVRWMSNKKHQNNSRQATAASKSGDVDKRQSHSSTSTRRHLYTGV